MVTITAGMSPQSQRYPGHLSPARSAGNGVPGKREVVENDTVRAQQTVVINDC